MIALAIVKGFSHSHNENNARDKKFIQIDSININFFAPFSSSRQIPVLPGLTKNGRRVIIMRGIFSKDMPITVSNITEAMKVHIYFSIIDGATMD